MTGLRAMHRAIAGACAAADPAVVRATVVLVPTRSAVAQLRLTLENLWLLSPPGASADRAAVFPDILTRGDWYRRLHQRAGALPVSPIEREVLLGAAAREAIAGGEAPPFHMRPGLVAEMLALYDGLQRRGKSVADFERLVADDLQARAEFDRGAERLLRQTRFLVAAFRLFDSKLDASGRLDEHRLRQHLIACGSDAGCRRVVIAMGDEAAEPSGGLFPADFDLFARLAGIESIEVVATRAALLAGLGERLRALLPGLEDDDRGDVDEAPSLSAPAAGDRLHFVSRDREEELRAIARRLKRELRGPGVPPRSAIVFRRPLPYVYLGRTVLESAGIDYQAADALPLAAEPFAAAVDLLFAAVASRFARIPLLQLLRSPHLRFAIGGQEARGSELEALDRALADAGYLGDPTRLAAFVEQAPPAAARASRVAAAVASALAPLAAKAPLSAHVATLLDFLAAYERPLHATGEAAERHLRARAAILRIFTDLRAAVLAHDDPPVDLGQLAATARRWIEAETFTPARGTCGVHLVDAQAARFGDFDAVHLAGLVAGDWPEPAARNIFYPHFLLAQLGWPSESARLAAERAAFVDLLRLGRRSVSVSTFTLEDDSIVEASPLLDETARAGLDVLRSPEADQRIFADEALVEPEGKAPSAAAPAAAQWLALRVARSRPDERQFHGAAGAAPAPAGRGYAVTAIDRYLECPFKYFARHVLDLSDSVADEQAMSPRERGRFVHEVFRAFFAEWQGRGGGTVTVAALDSARSLFAEIAEQQLSSLPRVEAALERMRLLGSAAAPGLGEVVLAAEAVRPTPVAERLLEFSFEGRFVMSAAGTERTVPLRGKADRVDLLTDGRLRVIDYKIGRAPADSIQLPVYALCLQQHLDLVEGRRWQIGEALYVAFGEPREPVQAVVSDGLKGSKALDEAQERVVAAVDGIERGDFPPRPAAPRLCASCAYAGVCRKDYVLAE